MASLALMLSCNQSAQKGQLETFHARPEKSVEPDSTISHSEKTYSLGEIKVLVRQKKRTGNDFSCESKLLVYDNETVLDSLIFQPDPVGGNYGISKPIRVDNHLVFTKHGDYDGRTIIVTESGQVFNIIGGGNYYDPESKMLFTTYDSDLNGLAVFNLSSDSTLIELSELKDRPISFYKAFGKRYFVLCSNEQGTKTLWEVELELGRIMQVDIDPESLDQANLLKSWKSEDVNCVCEN